MAFDYGRVLSPPPPQSWMVGGSKGPGFRCQNEKLVESFTGWKQGVLIQSANQGALCPWGAFDYRSTKALRL